MFTISEFSTSSQSQNDLALWPIAGPRSTTPPERSHSLPERVVREMEILDSMHLGVMVVSSELKLVYRNLKAQNICQDLLREIQGLPPKLVDACDRFIADRDRDQSDPFVWECYPMPGRKLHVQISWMDQQGLLKAMPDQPYMLIVIKDCYQALMAKTRRSQKRYGFTDREAQIWMMLDLSCSYQEIAAQLGISLNTVKTHVKNINVKRRNQPTQDRLWFVEDQDLW
jgi:DNA-binding CsgD family transcriptional regulator